jgi:hypothetical protein
MNKNRNGTYLCRLFEPSTDLIKQLYAFAGCVEHHIENNYHIIILDDFFHHKPVPVSTILDIKRLLYHLYNPPPFSPLKRGVKTLEIVDKNKLHFKLTSVIYGNDLKFDLTSHFHIKHNILDITQGLLDKAIEKKKYQEIGEKKLLIKYSLEDRVIDQTFVIKNDRSLTDKDRIFLDYSTSTFIRSPILHKGFCRNPLLFIDILKNIRFHERFYKIIDKITPSGNINIIDLALDDIHTYSKKLGVDENEFSERIENKYIEMIKKYIYKNDTTILLTNSISNRVISYLSDESYTYLVSGKLYESIDTTSLSEANFINITNSLPQFNIPLNMLEPISFLEEKQDSTVVITPLKMLDPISLPKFVKEKEIKQIEPEAIMLDMLDNMDIPIKIEDKPVLTIPPVPDSEILNICLALKCTNVFIGRNESSLGEYMLDICKNEKTYLFNYDMDKLIVEDCKNKDKEVCCCF